MIFKKWPDFFYLPKYNKNQCVRISYQDRHHQIYIDDDGDIMIRFGNSGLKRFAKQEDGSFVSPRGDYSTLEAMDDKYVRTLKDGTQYIFNTEGFLQEIRDRNNNITLYCYKEESNQLKYIEDPVGNRIHFAYNSAGKIESIRDPADRLTQFAYDDQGNLILITAPDGSTRRFQYNADHLLTGQVMENGATRFYYYDDFRRLSGSIFDDGTGIQSNPVSVDTIKDVVTGKGTASNPLGVVASEDVTGSFVDRNGNQEMIKVNDFGTLIERVNALGQRTQVERDENNNPTSVIDAEGRRKSYEYDDRGNLIRSTDVETGGITLYTYCGFINYFDQLFLHSFDHIKLPFS